MDDLVQVLTKSHREIVVPDVERIVGESERHLRRGAHGLRRTGPTAGPAGDRVSMCSRAGLRRLGAARLAPSSRPAPQLRLQEIFGRAEIDSTMRYTRVAVADLHKVIERLHDPDILAYCAAQGCVWITADEAAKGHVTEWLRTGRTLPGVIIVPQRHLGQPAARQTGQCDRASGYIGD